MLLSKKINGLTSAVFAGLWKTGRNNGLLIMLIIITTRHVFTNHVTTEPAEGKTFEDNLSNLSQPDKKR